MVIKDKDLFVQSTDATSVSPEDIAIAEGDQGTLTPEETTTTTTEDAVTTEDNPPEEAATTTETPAATTETETKAPESEKSIEEILNEIDNIQIADEKKVEATDKAMDEAKKEADTAKMNELLTNLDNELVAERTEKKKLMYTVDFLQQQIDTLTKENIGYKFGRTDDEGILQLINNDSGIKSIISQEIKTQSGNPADKEALVQAYKTKLENLTGLNFDDFINASKTKTESQMMSSEDDVATNVNAEDGEGLFL